MTACQRSLTDCHTPRPYDAGGFGGSGWVKARPWTLLIGHGQASQPPDVGDGGRSLLGGRFLVALAVALGGDHARDEAEREADADAKS